MLNEKGDIEIIKLTKRMLMSVKKAILQLYKRTTT